MCVYIYIYILNMYLIFAVLFFCFSLNPLLPHNMIYYGPLLFCTRLWGHKDAPCKASALRECGWTQLHQLTSDPISISCGGQAAQPEGSQGPQASSRGDQTGLLGARSCVCSPLLHPPSQSGGHITWDAPLAALVSGTLTRIRVWFSGPLASRQW